MNRSVLLILIILTLFLFTSNAQQPQLQVVSMDTLTSNIIVKWLYDEEIDPVVIYKCMGDCDYNGDYRAVDTIPMDQNNLIWIDLSPKINSADYYSIGWFLSDKQQTPQCNMHLDTLVSANGCRNEVSLSWNPYINMIDELDEYRIYYRIKDLPTSYFTLLDSIKGKHITARFEDVDIWDTVRYDARFLENGTTYEFMVKAINKTKTLFSYSNIAEYRTGFQPNAPVSVSLTGISVEEDKYFTIDFRTGYFPTPFHNLYLLRSEELGSFNIVDSAEHHSLNQYQFRDEDVDPHSGLYRYMAIAENRCKASDTSNVLSNIFLDGFRIEGEQYKDSVFFHHSGGDINDNYELLRLVGGIPFGIAVTLSLQQSRCEVDIEPFVEDGAVIHYQVKLRKNLNDYFSNILTIEHEPQVSFPNAFYPMSSIIENRTFYPIIRFASEADYLFIIYNRWGQEIYRSDLPPVYGDYSNLQGRWDGTFQGNECPSGFYAYKLRYSFNEGSGTYSNSGSFMLVR